MKTYILILISILFVAQGPTWANDSMVNSNSDILLEELLVRLKSSKARTMKDSYRHIVLKNFRVSEDSMSFRYKRLPIYIQWVGSKKVAIKINGMAFSPKELKTERSMHRALVRKLSLNKKSYSLFEMLIPQAEAKQAALVSEFLEKALGAAKNTGFYNLGVLVAAMGAPQADAFVYIMTMVSGGFSNFMAQAAAVPAVVDPATISKPAFMKATF